jgi:hypothetical protein
VDGSPTGSRDVAERRANTVLRAALLVFGLAYLAFAIVGYLVTGALGIAVRFVCIYGLTILIVVWGRRSIMRR